MNNNGFNNFNYQSNAGNLNGNNTITTPLTMPMNNTNYNISPINIGFVRGKIGVSAYPIMSSNTTVYLFDIQDQTKFYVKSTDAFGMAMPIREFQYHEITQQQTLPEILPINTELKPDSSDVTEAENQIISKKEFDEMKLQLASITEMLQKQNKFQNKPRKEQMNNV